jgi:hypothetical protein
MQQHFSYDGAVTEPHYSRGRGIAAGVVVLVFSLGTLGFGAGLMFAIIAIFVSDLSRRDLALLWGSVLVNAAAIATFLVSIAMGDSGNLLTWASFAVLLGQGFLEGILLAVVTSTKVAGRHVTPIYAEIAETAEDERQSVALDPALRFAIRQRERRAAARELVLRDPALADELKIGRPDLNRDFVDGGLIDVNAVPLWVLETTPGITSAIAKRIVEERTRRDGFKSSADLVVYADVPSEVVDQLGDILLFRPVTFPTADQAGLDDVSE